MATVELRDIVTEADREAVLGLRGPRPGAFLGSMASHSRTRSRTRGASRGCGPSTTATSSSGS